MREIIFRGKRIDNGEWVEGDLLQAPFHKNNKLNWQYSIMAQKAWADNYIVIPETVGQYTGLKDKNGIKIFEGDIVQGFIDITETYSEGNIEDGSLCWHDEIVNTIAVKEEVYYDVSAFRLGEFELAYFRTGNIEVIGNVYDNPELLKGGAE